MMPAICSKVRQTSSKSGASPALNQTPHSKPTRRILSHSTDCVMALASRLPLDGSITVEEHRVTSAYFEWP